MSDDAELYCGDYPAPCNCDDTTTHDGRAPAKVTQQDLDHVVSQVEERLLALANNVQNMFTELAERSEKLEQIVAGLIVGYAEQTVVIEALATHISSGLPEKRKEFLEHIMAGRAEMLKIMKEHGGVDMETGDTNLARAVEDLVNKKSAPPAS